MASRKNIVVDFSLFNLEQDIYCYIDGDCTEHRKVSLDDVPLTVMQLRKKYQISQISLVGNNEFATKMRDEIMEKGGLTFNECSIDIIAR